MSKKVITPYVRTEYQVDDVFTKALDRISFVFCVPSWVL